MGNTGNLLPVPEGPEEHFQLLVLAHPDNEYCYVKC